MTKKTKTKISASLKNYHHHKKVISDCKAVAGFMLMLCTVSILIKLGTPMVLADHTARYTFLPKNADKQEMTIQDKIIKAAQENNVDIKESLDVIFCESRFNPNAKNSKSTASGLAQFISGTWQNYCEGNVFNEDDNLKCFFKLYPSHKSWWECARKLNYVN